MARMRSWGSCHGTPCHHTTRSQCSTSTGRPQILNRAAHLEFGKFPPPSPTQSGRLDERMRSQSGSTERGSRSRSTLRGDRLRNGWNIVQEHKRRLMRWVNEGIKTTKELENRKTWNDIVKTYSGARLLTRTYREPFSFHCYHVPPSSQDHAD